MKVATLLLILYGAGSGSATAHVTGARVTMSAGQLQATGVQVVPQIARRLRVPVPPYRPLPQGARAPLEPAEAEARAGRLTAQGGARVQPAGVRARTRAGLAQPAGSAVVPLGQALAAFRAGDVAGQGGATARTGGTMAQLRAGTLVGHPQPAERAWLDLQREIAEEDELLVLGVLD